MRRVRHAQNRCVHVAAADALLVRNQCRRIQLVRLAKVLGAHVRLYLLGLLEIDLARHHDAWCLALGHVAVLGTLGKRHRVGVVIHQNNHIVPGRLPGDDLALERSNVVIGNFLEDQPHHPATCGLLVVAGEHLLHQERRARRQRLGGIEALVEFLAHKRAHKCRLARKRPAKHPGAEHAPEARQRRKQCCLGSHIKPSEHKHLDGRLGLLVGKLHPHPNPPHLGDVSALVGLHIVADAAACPRVLGPEPARPDLVHIVVKDIAVHCTVRHLGAVWDLHRGRRGHQGLDVRERGNRQLVVDAARHKSRHIETQPKSAGAAVAGVQLPAKVVQNRPDHIKLAVMDENRHQIEKL
eukprot:comp21202_c0_seq2/m.45115 comp21202_c0_seq2/g.45115  ORF comp21202_c0_seq2/g.45115 comp21202_c0_seq2/m.45115 type:complete len:353 (+) comp21202_c0_seq2:202-1260(+)